MRSASLKLILAAGGLLAGPAWAVQALDLSVPEAASPFRNDPPGTYYGDTSGVPLADPGRQPRGARCPLRADGEPAAVTGSVSTGIGYSSRLGNSHWNAASLDYCNEYTSADGQPRSINLHLDMGRYEGPGHAPMGTGMPGPSWHGPRPMAPAGRPPRR